MEYQMARLFAKGELCELYGLPDRSGNIEVIVHALTDFQWGARLYRKDMVSKTPYRLYAESPKTIGEKTYYIGENCMSLRALKDITALKLKVLNISTQEFTAPTPEIHKYPIAKGVLNIMYMGYEADFAHFNVGIASNPSSDGNELWFHISYSQYDNRYYLENLLKDYFIQSCRYKTDKELNDFANRTTILAQITDLTEYLDDVMELEYDLQEGVS